MRINRHLTALALVGALALAGCGDNDTDSDKGAQKPTSTSTNSPAGDAYTIKTLLPALKEAVEDNRTAHFSMEMPGALSAEGDLAYRHVGAEMQIEMDGQAFGGKAAMRVVAGDLYISLPGMTPKGKFINLDEDDPQMKGFIEQARTMDPLSTFDAFDAGLRKVELVGSEEIDGEAVDKYRLSVDAKAAFEASGQGSPPSLVPDTIVYDMWVTEDELMRRVAFELGPIKMTMNMTEWGEPVDIKKPAAADIIEMPGT